MEYPFWKMHGTGNDYIYFDCFEGELSQPEALAKRLSDRHRSIGGDGIILISRSDRADAKMRIFNRDGSEGRMCGNGIRCVGRFLREVKGIEKSRLTVETLSGVKELLLRKEEDGYAITVDMGRPLFHPDEIPALFSGESLVDRPLIVGRKTYRVTCLSMGNPHCVLFCDSPESLDLEKIGPKFERHPAFPEGVNVEFVKVCGERELFLRVYERGSGETMACGTGACAAVVAAERNGFCKKNEDIRVRLSGGKLTVNYTGETVLMTGPAEPAFRGFVEI